MEDDQMRETRAVPSVPQAAYSQRRIVGRIARNRSWIRTMFMTLAFAALAAALIYLWDGRNGLWVNHPIAANFAADFLMLAFAAVVFENLIDRSEQRRWQQVARLACHVLGDDYARAVAIGLAALYTPKLGVPTRLEAREGDKIRDLDPRDEMREVPAGKEHIKILQDGSLPSDAPPVDAHGRTQGLISKERLDVLLCDEEWLDWASGHITVLRRRCRDLVGRWAPVMILADYPRGLLNHMAELNDQLGYLRTRMEQTAETLSSLRAEANPATRVEKQERSQALAGECRQMWILVDARARVLTNELWAYGDRTFGSEVMSLLVPHYLEQTSAAEVFASNWSPAGSDAESTDAWIQTVSLASAIPEPSTTPSNEASAAATSAP